MDQRIEIIKSLQVGCLFSPWRKERKAEFYSPEDFILVAVNIFVMNISPFPECGCSTKNAAGNAHNSNGQGEM